MKNFRFRVVLFLINRFFKQSEIPQFLANLSAVRGYDLLTLSYNSMGILKYQNAKVSGEDHFARNVLKKLVADKKNMILFDVGANIGKYTESLSELYPTARIYAFEPNRYTYKTLQKYESEKIRCINKGLGSSVSVNTLYSYADNIDSAHASLYKNVLSDLHHSSQVKEIDFECSTLDQFADDENIQFIDVLKIDTEGHELEVLKGGYGLINQNRIGIIQFEFNEMNVISRVFLKDFYDLLNKYTFYRLDSNRLIKLPEYSTRNEIFQFQNFVAIHTELYSGIQMGDNE